MQNRNVLKLFPQPLIHYKFEDYKEQNIALEKYIKNLYEKNSDGLQRSNIDGWHSPDFSLKEKDTAAYKFFISLRKYLIDVFKILGWFLDKTEDFWNWKHESQQNYCHGFYQVSASPQARQSLEIRPTMSKPCDS